MQDESFAMTDCSERVFGIAVSWQYAQDPLYPYTAQVDNKMWMIRLNDFPEEALYTLIIDDNEITSFDDWPVQWSRIDNK